MGRGRPGTDPGCDGAKKALVKKNPTSIPKAAGDSVFKSRKKVINELFWDCLVLQE